MTPKHVKDAGSGVIGIGRVGAKSIKDEPAWWERIHSDGEIAANVYSAVSVHASPCYRSRWT